MRGHVWKLGVLLCLVAVLFAFLGADGTREAITPRGMLSAYRSVVLGEQGYLQTDPFEGTAAEALMASDIGVWYGYRFETSLRYEAFAITDLDRDGNPELLLKLSEDFGFELLRWYNGTVYGYPFVARAMEAVTADGEIHASGGAANFGWVTIAFSGGELLRSSVCWMSDEATDTVIYTIGGAAVSESEFQTFNDALWKKDMIGWTDYTPEALEAALGGE